MWEVCFYIFKKYLIKFGVMWSFIQVKIIWSWRWTSFLLEIYLKGCEQKVFLNGQTSVLKEIQYGVSQKSVGSTLLFNAHKQLTRGSNLCILHVKSLLTTLLFFQSFLILTTLEMNCILTSRKLDNWRFNRNCILTLIQTIKRMRLYVLENQTHFTSSINV